MILIADSGSTKTDWIICETNVNPQFCCTKGFNPYYQSVGEFEEIVEEGLKGQLDYDSITEIYYYGSGCSTVNKKQIIKDILERYFKNAKKIEVEHDLLAAARALCGREVGIACILGTGMNSCKYDGQNITDNLNSLGFMFADEGSGSHLGKVLLSYYFKGKLSDRVAGKFKCKYNITLEEMLGNVYNASGIGKYLASFSPFILENIEEPEIRQIAEDCFTEFFEENILRYDGYEIIPCSFVGSIAFYYHDVIAMVAKKYGIRMGRILKTPALGLIEYHAQ